MFKLPLTKRYIIAVSLIAVFIILGNIITNKLISTNDEYAKIINISGKQRMLSQRLIVLAHTYNLKPTSINKQILLDNLTKMRTSHTYLLTKVFTNKLNNIYFKQGLNKNLKYYLSIFDNLLQTNDKKYITEAMDLSTSILKQLDKAVKEYEIYTNIKLKELNDYEFYLMLIALLILILEIIFIFMPIERQMEQSSYNFKKQHNMLIQQSKMASMGEMVENITHQWRQPLNAISSTASCLMVEKEIGILEDEELDGKLDEIILKAQFLSQTIEDFKNFFTPTKDKIDVSINNVISNVQKIVSATLKINSIALYKNYDDNIELKYKCFGNELSQVLINIFNNAKDILIEKDIDNRAIQVELFKTSSKLVIKVYDSGGGISQDILPKIFKPYFTTKDKDNGTGIGLYMSHRIIKEHFKGTLKASNQDFTIGSKSYFGACFTISLPL